MALPVFQLFKNNLPNIFQREYDIALHWGVSKPVLPQNSPVSLPCSLSSLEKVT